MDLDRDTHAKRFEGLLIGYSAKKDGEKPASSSEIGISRYEKPLGSDLDMSERKGIRIEKEKDSRIKGKSERD